MSASTATGWGGLEHKYNGLLKGKPVWIYAERDARAAHLIAEAPDAAQARGKSLVLTLDQTIQHIVEDELERAVDKSQAKGGFAVFIDPATGEILAMAQVPRLNPNNFGASPVEQRKVTNITDVFEPGSTMKPIFMSVLLEEGGAKTNEKVFCENGEWKVHGRVIHDHVPHATLSLADIIKLSSNIGVAKLSQKLTKKALYEGYRRFGFGLVTGIEMGGESRGIMHEPSRWSLVTPMTIAYGQGISVTALQLTAAIGALANDGMLMRPYIVGAVLDENGNEIERTEPEELGRAIAPATANLMMDWMEQVVHGEGGTGASAGGAGYTVAGKTGTAWKVDQVNGGYDRRKVVASFAGAAPAKSPRIVGLVAIDEPTKGSRYGGVIAAPVFREIARRTLSHLNVPPDRPVEVAKKRPGKRKVKRTASVKATPLGRGEVTAGKMPDLRGLTMREALTRLERTGVSIRLDVRGSGFAATQRPRAGAALGEGALCTVEFQPSPQSVAEL